MNDWVCCDTHIARMRKTDSFYNQNAQQFFDSTVKLNMQDLYEPFLAGIPKHGRILDAGCGSGRDAKHFEDLGFSVVAFDSSSELCNIASVHLGQKVLNGTFQDIQFENEFDGVWACASLLHLSMSELPAAFKRLNLALKKDGVMYCSLKHGDFEGERNGRYFTDLSWPSLQQLTSAQGFSEKKYWITSDVRPDRKSEEWLNGLFVKSE